MNGAGVVVWAILAAAAGPVGAKPAPPDAALAREAAAFARMTVALADDVAQAYLLRPVTPNELLEGGLAELYASAGRKLPPEYARRLAAATDTGSLLNIVADARVELGAQDGLTTPRAFVVTANGFSRATDPFCGLVLRNNTLPMTSDAEFGLGFELAGATGAAWHAYVLSMLVPEYSNVPAPAAFPWRVRRVIPGSPAARAGLRAGDEITHLNGKPLDAKNHDSLFRLLAAPNITPQAMNAPAAGDPAALAVRVTRGGAAVAKEIKLARDGYTPESIFGATRKENGAWDYVLDREAKIGYVRVGAVESQGGGAFERAVTGLVREGAAGLVLDLRWCPGGYVNETVHVIDVLLPPGKTIVTIQSRKPDQLNSPTEYTSSFTAGGEALQKLPLVVLVNHETTGGGEMIAAALQDHARGPVVGQRTFGKANIMSIVTANQLTGLAYRVSTGYSLRPNGKNRHRFSDSKPSDPWGVKPDRGYEIPMTPDLSARLQAEVERFSARPAEDRGAVAYDDPFVDPQRLLAVRYLKEQIRAAEKKAGGEKK